MRTLEQDRDRKKIEYAEDPVKHRLKRLKWRINNPEKAMWSSAKARAANKVFEFNITPEDIVIPEVCPVFNRPFDMAKGEGTQRYSASLDRIDSSKGYVKDNIRVVSWRANDLLSNGTLEEFKDIVRFLNG